MTPQTPKKQQDLERSLEGKLSDIHLQKIKEGASALAQKLGLPYISLIGYPIETDALVVLKEPEARSGQMIVISKSGSNLKIAVLNPESDQTKEILSSLSKKGFSYSIAITSPPDLSNAFERYKNVKMQEEVKLGVVGIGEEELSDLQKQIKNIADLKDRLLSLPISKILNILLAGALKIEASDVHFENEESQIRLRYRVDGILTDVVEFSKKGYDQLLSRVKLMSGLKINIRNKPQDGRFTIRQEEMDIEIRTSIIPSEYGENIVLRVLNPKTIKQNLEDLGMRQETLETVKHLLKKNTGAIITTGPTGSGKTTTLYSFLRHVNGPGVKIITIEDPVEYHLPGITQTQTDSKAGYTFSTGLKSIVRQDPDVILVGEIRDGETAEIAMQAALTGHQVFTTLHTNNAAGAIPRLIDLGVKPVTIAPAINATMAQRLIRKLCPDCKKKQPLTKDYFEKIKDAFAPVEILKNNGIENLSELTEVFYPSKCVKCNSTGYKGRLGLFEIFEIDADLEKLVQTGPAISDVENLAIKKGMITLLQDGLIKVLQGITSMEEIIRVIGE